ncbi:hypothetical protein H0I23_15695 [Cellulophaga sp. HaHaR_3_176]|uniref:hypothetical protein n=1 Tax=Cellulophaga sp. HaHaR_3_176 TaxID=1942464 RepID=UPI001C1FC8C9|nr:hypothetical protein [Cellulophaga sp. HaHaR_3_176]QWX83873.1 hypothetical protein H0I23_15695 [Cellulophaga sp. HaHaR_3_176]
MRNTNFTSFEEIELELMQYNLERKIALEEIKGIKHQIQEDLQPANWLQSGFKIARKLSTVMLLKKLFK